MPTFTLVIADEPFSRDDRGPAPFIETVEHGANGQCSTPATEAFKRCLNAIAESGEPESVADDDYDDAAGEADDDGEESEKLSAYGEVCALADVIEEKLPVLIDMAAGRRKDGYEVDRFEDYLVEGMNYAGLRRLSNDAADKLEAALQSMRKVVAWPDPESEDGE